MSDPKATCIKLVDELGNESQRSIWFNPDNLLDPEDKNTFECQGCRQLCCHNKSILLRPSEFYRIDWFLHRHPMPLPTDQWASFGINAESGIPVAFTATVQTETRGLQFCPFLLPVFDENGNFAYPQSRCAIHSVRPVACRVYPYGLRESFNLKTGEIQASMTVLDRCKGFETPPKHTQTVADYINDVYPATISKEIICSELLLSGLTEVGLHERTPNYPTSLLPDGLTYKLLKPLLFNAPPCPEDPSEDHKVIIEHLQALEVKRDQLVEIFTEVENGELSLSEGMGWATALVA